MDISGKVAIVTGAARGIGRATAVALARAGARAVVLADVRAALCEEAAKSVREAGAEALAVETDVTDAEALRGLIAETEARFGGVHILHNNAGLGEGATDWPEVSTERVGAIVDVNLRAVITGTQLALEPMKRSGGGVVVNTSSGGAFIPLPPQAVYVATKAGVVHFTRSCEPLEASHGVRVCCICPGLVSTDMIQETGIDGPAAWLAPIIEGVVMLTPEDIAARVLELIRDPDCAGKVVNIENQARGSAE
jgi:NAD(P)-dependent dehydrogenase (short-subunit alcohol dehydrogenase family)